MGAVCGSATSYLQQLREHCVVVKCNHATMSWLHCRPVFQLRRPNKYNNSNVREPVWTRVQQSQTHVQMKGFPNFGRRDAEACEPNGGSCRGTE